MVHVGLGKGLPLAAGIFAKYKKFASTNNPQKYLELSSKGLTGEHSVLCPLLTPFGMAPHSAVAYKALACCTLF